MLSSLRWRIELLFAAPLPPCETFGLNRTQPGLPLKPGRCGTMTHDYKRNGTTTLFAALDLLQGKVIGDFHQRHRHQEFLKFLRRMDRELPGGKTLHLVMDNYGTHGHAAVTAWVKKHPQVSAPHGSRTSGRENPALGHGQLRYARACRGQSLAQETSPLCVPLCADQLQLAEPGGTLVCGTDQQVDPPRFFLQRRRAHRRDPGVPGGLE